jgi:hypothetical protein
MRPTSQKRGARGLWKGPTEVNVKMHRLSVLEQMESLV